MNDPINLKITYFKNPTTKTPSDIRRLRLPADATLEQFIEQIKIQQSSLDFDTDIIQFQYQDEENDTIQFSTEEEWSIALDTIKIRRQQQASTLLRVTVTTLGKKSVPVIKGKKKYRCGKARHHGVICDGCNKNAFTGNRYRCQDCADFDYCEKCFSSSDVRKKHPFNHMFTKIAPPLRVRNEDTPSRHYGVCCDGCGAYNFEGTRHKCTNCNDYDLCDTCIQNSSIRMQHFRGTHQFNKIESKDSHCAFTRCQQQPAIEPVAPQIDETVFPSAPPLELEPKLEQEVQEKPKEVKTEEKEVEPPQPFMFTSWPQISLVFPSAPPLELEPKLEQEVQEKPKEVKTEEKEVEPPQPFMFTSWPQISHTSTSVHEPEPEPHLHELDQLHAMGFTDRENNIRLLCAHSGDIATVVQHLLEG
jgi:hypothetical protein